MLGSRPVFHLPERIPSKGSPPSMKLKMIYAPVDGERQEFVFDDDELGAREAEALEEAGGQSWDTLMEWLDKFQRGSFKAWRAALWVCMRRQDPTLDFDLFLPSTKELQIEDFQPEPAPEGKGEPGGGSTGSP